MMECYWKGITAGEVSLMLSAVFHSSIIPVLSFEPARNEEVAWNG